MTKTKHQVISSKCLQTLIDNHKVQSSGIQPKNA